MGSGRKDITLDERVGIGLLAATCRGMYGTVSDLARGLGTSRQFIYTLENKVLEGAAEALEPRKPGPRPRSHVLEVDREHLDLSVVTLALLDHAAQRPIAESLGIILGVKPSVGYVNEVLDRACKAAAEFNGRLRLELAGAQVAADELFSLGKGHLVTVEHKSLLILLLQQVERVDEAAWRESFAELRDRGVQLARVASDGGAAVTAAVAKLAQVDHNLDPWHAMRHVGRALALLEGAAYKAIRREEKLAKKAQEVTDPEHLMGQEVGRAYREARAETVVQIERYDRLRILGRWVKEAMEPVELGTGRLRDYQECLGDLQAATELMRELGTKVAEKLADYLDKAGPSLLAYVRKLEPLVAVLVDQLGEEGVRYLCREWQLERKGAARQADGQKEYLRAHLLSLLYWGQRYSQARQKVVGVLESMIRASSSAECVNSWLRPYAELFRGLQEKFLPLFQLFRNGRVFERGKRAGHSPFQLAGIQTPEGDWRRWLNLADKPSPTRSVRSLPKTISTNCHSISPIL
jgi:hypothetical protein